MESRFPPHSSSSGSQRDPLQRFCPCSRPEHIKNTGVKSMRSGAGMHEQSCGWLIMYASFAFSLPYLTFLQGLLTSCAPTSSTPCFSFCHIYKDVFPSWWMANRPAAPPCGQAITWRHGDQPDCTQSRSPPLWLTCCPPLSPGQSLSSAQSARG